MWDIIIAGTQLVIITLYTVSVIFMWRFAIIWDQRLRHVESSTWVCEACSAQVEDLIAHDEWHRALSE